MLPQFGTSQISHCLLSAAKHSDDHLDSWDCSGSGGEEALKTKLQKKASVVFERKQSDGSSFWSLSARNSVTSMFEGAEAGPEQPEADTEAAETVKNPRRLLQKKRSSLAHQPSDPQLVDRRTSQAADTVHEFQKVSR